MKTRKKYSKRKPVTRPEPKMPVDDVVKLMDGDVTIPVSLRKPVAWSPDAGLSSIVKTCEHMTPLTAICELCAARPIPWLDWTLREFWVGVVAGCMGGLLVGFIAAARFFS